MSTLHPDEIARVRAPLERAFTLPPKAYVSASLFESEKANIFARSWLCAGRAQEVAEPGDFKCVDLPGLPIVIVRDLGGELHALSRICVHRAMPVAEGSGNAKRFVCPYHRWTYELNGALRSAPLMSEAEGFDAESCRLPALKLAVWEGFVFVNADLDAPDLATELTGLKAEIAPYDFARLVSVGSIEFPSPWNWKILVENFMEAYHHIGPHRETFEPTFPAKRSSTRSTPGQPWALLDMPMNAPAGVEATVFPNLSEADRSRLFAAMVFPTCLFAASPQGAAWYEITVRGVDDMHLKVHALTVPEVADQLGDEERAQVLAGLRHIHEEDITVNEGPWRGLQSQMARQGPLSHLEESIWLMNQLWLDRMGF